MTNKEFEDLIRELTLKSLEKFQRDVMKEYGNMYFKGKEAGKSEAFEQIKCEVVKLRKELHGNTEWDIGFNEALCKVLVKLSELKEAKK